MDLIDVIRGIAGVSWLAVFAVIGFLVVRATRRQSTKGMVYLLIVVVVSAALLNAGSAGLVFIEPNEIGVVETTAREAAVKGHLATFESDADAFSGTGLLPLVSAAGSFSEAGALAAPEALAAVLGAGVRFDVVKSHNSWCG